MGLFDPIWKTKNKARQDRAVKSVKKITDSDKLKEIAMDAPLCLVRQAAVDMLTEQVSAVSDEESLLRIVSDRQTVPEVSEAALERIRSERNRCRAAYAMWRDKLEYETGWKYKSRYQDKARLFRKALEPVGKPDGENSTPDDLKKSLQELKDLRERMFRDVGPKDRDNVENNRTILVNRSKSHVSELLWLHKEKIGGVEGEICRQEKRITEQKAEAILASCDTDEKRIALLLTPHAEDEPQETGLARNRLLQAADPDLLKRIPEEVWTTYPEPSQQALLDRTGISPKERLLRGFGSLIDRKDLDAAYNALEPEELGRVRIGVSELKHFSKDYRGTYVLAAKATEELVDELMAYMRENRGVLHHFERDREAKWAGEWLRRIYQAGRYRDKIEKINGMPVRDHYDYQTNPECSMDFHQDEPGESFYL